MSKKWQWILFIWHDWRGIVWHAETTLYALGGVRWNYAKIMCEFHESRASSLHRQLFPPTPMSIEEVKRALTRRNL